MVHKVLSAQRPPTPILQVISHRKHSHPHPMPEKRKVFLQIHQIQLYFANRLDHDFEIKPVAVAFCVDIVF